MRTSKNRRRLHRFNFRFWLFTEWSSHYLTLFAVFFGLVVVGLFVAGAKAMAWRVLSLPIAACVLMFLMAAAFIFSHGIECVLVDRPVYLRVMIGACYLLMAVGMALVGVSGIAGYLSHRP